MKYINCVIGVFCAILCVFYFVSEYQLRSVKEAYKPIGKFADISRGKMHYVDVNAASSTATPVLFIHGAGSNLNDYYHLFAFKKVGPPLPKELRLIFVDRPGHGLSDIEGAQTPQEQAKRYIELLDHLNIEQVVLVSHSMGSVSALAMAIRYPSRVKGIVMMAPVGIPEPINVEWYYPMAATPVVGPIFAKTMVIPFQRRFLKKGMMKIFHPQLISRYYWDFSRMEFELQPKIFLQNAREVVALSDETKKLSRSYGDIKQKVVIVAGDEDAIVDTSLQAVKLAKAIPGAELTILPGIGHKPAYQDKKLIMKAIVELAK